MCFGGEFMESIFCCPVCYDKMMIDEKTYRCKNNHCFDVARFGYVNLSKSQQSFKKRHGDDKLMVQARSLFLSSGHYRPFADVIAEKCVKYCNNQTPTIIDIGCGEGYYTKRIYNSLSENGYQAKLGGIDISKDALRYCKKAVQSGEYAVASAYHLPIADNSCDVLVNIFAPYSADEFNRVLKADGVVIRAFARKNHLLELKQAIYNDVRDEDVEDLSLNGFDIAENVELKYEIKLKSNEEINNLFKMTPYYYKTSMESQKRLENIDNLSTTVSFSVVVYKKSDNN